MPAPSESISVVQRLSCCALIPPAMAIEGGGAPSSAAVRLPTTTPNTRAKKTDSSSIPPRTPGISRPGWVRESPGDERDATANKEKWDKPWSPGAREPKKDRLEDHIRAIADA